MTITQQDLEDAAKVAGIRAIAESCKHLGVPIAVTAQETLRYWNPLTNPADTWDLAEKCGMHINFKDGVVCHWDAAGIDSYKRFTIGNQQEACEAIVLAAAEIFREGMNKERIATQEAALREAKGAIAHLERIARIGADGSWRSNKAVNALATINKALGE